MKTHSTPGSLRPWLKTMIVFNTVMLIEHPFARYAAERGLETLALELLLIGLPLNIIAMLICCRFREPSEGMQ